jgi:hypothetical protein
MPRIVWIPLCVLAVIGAAAVTVFGLYVMATGEPGSSGYVIRKPTGMLVIGYRGCPGEFLKDVTVTDESAPGTLWTVTQTGAAPTSEITLGQVPAEYRQATPLKAPPADHVIRFELISTSGTASTVQLKLSDLPPDQYWAAGDTEPTPSSKLDTSVPDWC